MKRAEPYLQHDTIPKWDMLTFFEATFPISLSSDIDIGREDGGAALEGWWCFHTCSRRRLQLKNIHGGTCRCDGGTAPSKRIWATLL